MKTIGNTFFIFLRNNACVFTENIKAQNKNQIPLLDSLISCISAKSAPQILSIKDECTFLFYYFIIFLFFFLITAIYFLILAAIGKIFIPIAELIIPIGTPNKEEKAENEIHPVI